MLHQKRSEPSDRAENTHRIGRRGALRRLALVPALAVTAAFLPTGLSAAAFDLGNLPIPIPGAGGSNDPNQSPLPTLPAGVKIPAFQFGSKKDHGISVSNNGITLPSGEQLAAPQLDAPVQLYGEVLLGGLYRSSQPSPEGFAWLKSSGIKTIVDLRDEHDDAPVIGPLGFGKYVYIPIVDNTPPTNAQAEQFLALVTDRGNWPILVHCNYGVGRAGAMSVLTRYAVQGMSMDDAYASSILFGGGPFPQAVWLADWAQTHSPGDHPLPG